MDAMMLAQLKRTAAVAAEDVHRLEQTHRSANLAVETAKKDADLLKKKLADARRRLEQCEIDVHKADEEIRRKIANDRQMGRSD